MVTYASGSITFSGLGSDVDFDDLRSKLYKIESRYANQLIEWRSDWKLRLDAFAEIRTELNNMRTALAKLNTVDKFLVKNVTSSNSGVATATLTSAAGEGTYHLNVENLATAASWSMATGAQSASDVVNSSGADAYFTYTYKGQQKTIAVPDGTTLEGLKNLINNDFSNPGVKVSLVQTAQGVVFQLRGMDLGADATLSIDSLQGLDLGMSVGERWTSSGGGNVLTHYGSYAGLGDTVNSSASSQNFVFSVGGVETSVTLAPGATLNDLVTAINGAGTSVTAGTVTNSDGTLSLTLTDTAANGDLAVSPTTTLQEFGTAGLPGGVWEVQSGVNARVRVDGWPADPEWLELSSNSFSYAEGVTFNLYSSGEAVITIGIDTEAIQENVESFVEAVNSFRALIQEMTSFDADQTTIDVEYAESLFEMQKGSILTGNYGVQLMSSKLKQIIAGSAAGFVKSGAYDFNQRADVFTSLSQIGIATDANQSSDNYGLLIITDYDDNYIAGTVKSFEDALAEDPYAVAELFAASSKGVSNSSNMAYSSHVPGITGNGMFEVSYDVVGGAITNATINGKAAQVNGNQIYLTNADGSAANAADGLYIDILDLTDGVGKKGSVSIQNGIINELIKVIDNDILDTENGSLSILERNYKNIIQNIDDKLVKEQTRLEKWDRTLQLRFARLEETLTRYNKINDSLASQIESLKASNS